MATISFDLVSPEQLIFNDEVGMIIVPGKDGDIGILPGHSKVLSSLRPGRIMIYNEDKSLSKSFFVSGGFVEINPEKCIVLAEDVNEMNSLDKLVIEKEMQELENQESDESKAKLIIAKKQIEALNSKYYEKIN
jgi:F-type H+-transporting ATPase subunit epsilon